jgi:hypothetical protein
MTKKLVASLMAVVVVTSMGACGSDDSVDSGVVIKKSSKWVTIREDDGEKEKHRYRNIFKCKIGDRWPDCKKK